MSNVGDPFRFATVVTPSDVTRLESPARGLYVTATGNVSVQMAGDDSTVILPVITAGTLLPFQVTRVNATGTTVAAGNIFAGWG